MTQHGDEERLQQGERDYGQGRWAVWLPILIALVGALGGGGAWAFKQAQEWKEQSDSWKVENQTLTDEYLSRISIDLVQTHSIQKYLYENYMYNNMGVLESYVYRARDNGGKGSPDELRQIKKLAALDADILERLRRYHPCALTSSYEASSRATISYLGIYVERAANLEALSHSDELIPVFDVFPDQFPSALRDEIAARKTATRDSAPNTKCALKPSGD